MFTENLGNSGIYKNPITGGAKIDSENVYDETSSSGGGALSWKKDTKEYESAYSSSSKRLVKVEYRCK